VVVESGDITDLERLRAIGRAHRITGIVHLAGSMPWPRSPEAPVARAQTSLGSLFNVIQVAQEWEVARVCVASTIGVYAGATNPLEGPLTEDKRLAITGSGARLIPTFKKVGELLGGYLADVSGVDVVNLRISGTWGPLGHPDPFFPAPELIHGGCTPRTRSTSATSRTPAARSHHWHLPTVSTIAPTTSPPAARRPTPRSPPRSNR
jgi:UDP-glucose 4-epimerase